MEKENKTQISMERKIKDIIRNENIRKKYNDGCERTSGKSKMENGGT